MTEQDPQTEPPRPSRRTFGVLLFAIGIGIGIYVLTKHRSTPDPATQIAATHTAAARCLATIRRGQPDDWSIERIIDQRALRDGWERLPPCEPLSRELEGLRRAVGEDHLLLQFDFYAGAPLSASQEYIERLGRSWRRLQAALEGLAVEHGLSATPLLVDGSAPPGYPTPIQLPRWSGEAADYRTSTWPLGSEVVVIETGRTLPGRGDCAAGAARHCYRYRATRVDWQGTITGQADLRPPSPDVQWRKWLVTDGGVIVAQGFGEAEGATPPVVATYAPGQSDTVLARLPAGTTRVDQFEVIGDEVRIESGKAWLAAEVDGSPLSFVVVPPAAAAPPAKPESPASPEDAEATARAAREAEATANARRMITLDADNDQGTTIKFVDGAILRIEKWQRELVAAQLGADGRASSVVRIGQLYGELGHVSYIAAYRAGTVAVVFTHPSVRATSLLLSKDSGRSWISVAK